MLPFATNTATFSTIGTCVAQEKKKKKVFLAFEAQVLTAGVTPCGTLTKP